TVVDASRAERRLEPGVAAEVVGRAVDVGRDTARGQRGVDRPHHVIGAGGAASRIAGRVAARAPGGDAGLVGAGRGRAAGGHARLVAAGAAGGDPGLIGARRVCAAGGVTRRVGAGGGRARLGRRDGRAGHHADGGAGGGGAGRGPAPAVVAARAVDIHGGGGVVGVGRGGR